MPEIENELRAPDSVPLAPDSATTTTVMLDAGDEQPPIDTDDRLIAWGGAVKSIAPNRIGGYLAVWGSPQEKDAQGEYFTPETDFALEYYANRPALYHHSLDATIGGLKVGTIDTLKLDEAGLWAEAQIEEHNAYVQKIRELVDKGVLGWSSGSVPHWVDVDKSGQIKRWPIVEGSLTPTPADWRGKTRVMTMKAYLEQVSVETEGEPPAASLDTTPAQAADAPTEPQAEEAAVTEAAAKADRAAAGNEPRTRPMRGKQMSSIANIIAAMQEQGIEADKILAIVAGMAGETAAPAMDADVSEEEMQREEEQVVEGAMSSGKSKKAAASMDALVTAKVEAALKAAAQPVSAASNGGKISGVRSRLYDDVPLAQLVTAAHLMTNAPIKNVHGATVEASSTLLRAVHERLSREVEYTNNPYGKEYAVKAALGAVKADEIFSATTNTQFVSTAWDTQIISNVREAPMYQQLVSRGMIEKTIPQGASTLTIPVEGNDFEVYSLVEQNDLTGDERLPVLAKAGTVTARNRSITAGMIGARLAYSFIAEEDMIVDAAGYINSKVNTVMPEKMERVMFQGDTTTTASTNINFIDGTPSVDAKGRGPDYLATDGIFKLPLVTNTSLSGNAGNSLSDVTFLEALKLLPSAQQVDYSRLMFVLDPSTYIAALNIALFKTRDINSSMTIESGRLSNAWGIDVLRSGFIGSSSAQGKTNSAGKIDSTAANNTRGRILLIRPDRWILGLKRQMTTEQVRDADAQANIVIATTRFCVAYVETSGGAAVMYNVAV